MRRMESQEKYTLFLIHLVTEILGLGLYKSKEVLPLSALEKKKTTRNTFSISLVKSSVKDDFPIILFSFVFKQTAKATLISNKPRIQQIGEEM